MSNIEVRAQAMGVTVDEYIEYRGKVEDAERRRDMFRKAGDKSAARKVSGEINKLLGSYRARGELRRRGREDLRE